MTDCTVRLLERRTAALRQIARQAQVGIGDPVQAARHRGRTGADLACVRIGRLAASAARCAARHRCWVEVRNMHPVNDQVQTAPRSLGEIAADHDQRRAGADHAPPGAQCVLATCKAANAPGGLRAHQQTTTRGLRRTN